MEVGELQELLQSKEGEFTQPQSPVQDLSLYVAGEMSKVARQQVWLWGAKPSLALEQLWGALNAQDAACSPHATGCSWP